MFGTYQFFFFAKKWPGFIRKWTRHEMVFFGKMYENRGFSLKFKIRLVAGFIFTLAFSKFLFLMNVGRKADESEQNVSVRIFLIEI